jgi:hypothetical protein
MLAYVVVPEHNEGERVSASQRQLMGLSGLACIVGGVCIAAFVLVHPWDQLVGSEIARTWRWQTAHTLHFIGALFALLGLLGIYARQRDQLGSLGVVGFVLSFIGNAMFLGTGMITAFIWPMLAVHAPSAVELDGAIFHAPVSAFAFLLTAVIMIVGYMLFGIAMLRARVFPRWSIITLMAGSVLGMLPPHPATPFPWAGLVLGGVLYGAAMVWLGSILWMENRAAASKNSSRARAGTRAKRLRAGKK